MVMHLDEPYIDDYNKKLVQNECSHDVNSYEYFIVILFEIHDTRRQKMFEKKLIKIIGKDQFHTACNTYVKMCKFYSLILFHNVAAPIVRDIEKQKETKM